MLQLQQPFPKGSKKRKSNNDVKRNHGKEQKNTLNIMLREKKTDMDVNSSEHHARIDGESLTTRGTECSYSFLLGRQADR